MRIALVGPAHPLRGGIANFNEALARALNAAGHSVTVFSFSLQYPSFLFPGKTQLDGGKAPADLDIHPCINSINPFSWPRAAKNIIANKPDLVLVRYWLPFMAPSLGTIARKLRRAGIRVIAITDNIIPHEKRIGDQMLTRYFIRSCDGFITLSSEVLKDLERFTRTPNKIMLPHPVYDIFGQKVSKEEALKHLGLSLSGKHILFFGFIRKYKGLSLLLSAMADTRLRELGIKLIVAGEFYEDPAPYLDLIKTSGLEECVILRSNYIPSEEVKYYFCAADMVVQPYITATQSGVAQIAYHFERPVLVTDVGGLGEIVPNGRVGYVCKPDPRAIADSIFDLYQNKREEQFSLNMKEEKKRFSWERFVEGLLAFASRLQ